MRKCRCYLCYIFEVTSVSFYNKTKLAQVGQIIQFKQSWQKIVCLKSEKGEEVGSTVSGLRRERKKRKENGKGKQKRRKKERERGIKSKIL